MAGKNEYGDKFNTPVGRVSYPHVFKKSKGKDGKDGKYELTLLIPKATDITDLRGKIDAVGKKAFGAAWEVVKKKKPTVRDGDEWADEKKAEGKSAEEYRGHWFIHPRTTKRPAVVGPNKVEIDEDDESGLYGGCYARCNVTPGSYDVDGSKGVTLFLNAIQKARDGERFGGGGVNTDEVFDEFEDANPEPTSSDDNF